MSEYYLDETDFQIMRELPASFMQLYRTLPLSDGTLGSRLSKLNKWGYISNENGRFHLTKAGELALKTGPNTFKNMAEKRKWAIISDASEDLKALATLEVKVGPKRKLMTGVIIDDEPTEKKNEYALAACRLPNFHEFIFHRPLIRGRRIHRITHESLEIRAE